MANDHQPRHGAPDHEEIESFVAASNNGVAYGLRERGFSRIGWQEHGFWLIRMCVLGADQYQCRLLEI